MANVLDLGDGFVRFKFQGKEFKLKEITKPSQVAFVKRQNEIDSLPKGEEKDQKLSDLMEDLIIGQGISKEELYQIPLSGWNIIAEGLVKKNQ